ncbi:MAG: hypothetical protein ACLFU1_00805 [Alphaproteobacteria bacterium]
MIGAIFRKVAGTILKNPRKMAVLGTGAYAFRDSLANAFSGFAGNFKGEDGKIDLTEGFDKTTKPIRALAGGVGDAIDGARDKAGELVDGARGLVEEGTALRETFDSARESVGGLTEGAEGWDWSKILMGGGGIGVGTWLLSKLSGGNMNMMGTAFLVGLGALAWFNRDKLGELMPGMDGDAPAGDRYRNDFSHLDLPVDAPGLDFT